MADSLQSKYKGFIILNKEIGPIELEVDTSAKTVTPSLPAGSEYSIAGGGGGLEYVIPEQTVTYNGNPADLSNCETFDDTTYYIIKIVHSDYPTSPVYFGALNNEGITASDLFMTLTITQTAVATTMEVTSNETSEPITGTYTISAIKAPF